MAIRNPISRQIGWRNLPRHKLHFNQYKIYVKRVNYFVNPFIIIIVHDYVVHGHCYRRHGKRHSLHIGTVI